MMSLQMCLGIWVRGTTNQLAQQLVEKLFRTAAKQDAPTNSKRRQLKRVAVKRFLIKSLGRSARFQ